MQRLPAVRATEHAPQLSRREHEVRQIIAQGLSTKEVAVHLQPGVKSVETYQARAMEKLGFPGHVALMQLAIRQGAVRASAPYSE